MPIRGSRAAPIHIQSEFALPQALQRVVVLFRSCCLAGLDQKPTIASPLMKVKKFAELRLGFLANAHRQAEMRLVWNKADRQPNACPGQCDGWLWKECVDSAPNSAPGYLYRNLYSIFS